jgi:hypothetical protein
MAHIDRQMHTYLYYVIHIAAWREPLLALLHRTCVDIGEAEECMGFHFIYQFCFLLKKKREESLLV